MKPADLSPLTRLTARLLLMLIKGYQHFISPMLPARCRYYPTCSHYGQLAVLWHGPTKGAYLTIKRVSRCHPLGGSGIDFVPLPLYLDSYAPPSKHLTDSSVYSSTHPSKVTRIVSGVSCETLLIERGVFRDRSSYAARLNAWMALQG